MIRAATNYDVDHICDLMRRYRDEAADLDMFRHSNDESYVRSLLAHILAGRGVAIIDDAYAGMILAMINPSIWDPEILALNELAYYVVPEQRGGTLGYRLLKEYIHSAERLKTQGRIVYYTISKMTSSPDLNYNRFGFQKIEETWIQ